MGYFKNINLENYRNFNNFQLDFSSGCNILIGPNGSGKTNILESISLFERGRGIRKENIKNLINNKSKKQHFKITSIFSHKLNNINLLIENQTNDFNMRKKIFINEDSSKESTKYLENIFSLIYFLPEMERLFLNSPSIRRNFLDRLIYSFNKNYNKIINNYKKNILERSNLLKNNNYDADWINSLEKEIVSLGMEIYDLRKKHLFEINNHLENIGYKKLYPYQISLTLKDTLFNDAFSNHRELEEVFLAQLKNNRSLDAILGGCKIGPHKSDIEGRNIEDNFNLNQFSTGQQKTIILLIILAQCKLLINNYNIIPVILFDEVCSHLDEENRKLLLDIIEKLEVQTFMTGTDKRLFSFLSTKAKYCNINDSTL